MWQAVNYTHAILLLLTNPVLGWVTWYGSTQHDDVSNYVTATTRNENLQLNNEVHNNTARTSDGAVDVLRLLNVSAATPGVSLVVGPAPGLPAYKLRPSYGLVQVPSPSALTAALTSSAGFTLVFIYRQHRKSLGTLLSVHSPGRVSPWFQLTSNLRTNQLVLHYRLTSDTKLHQNSWSLLPPHADRSNAISPEPRKGGSGWTHIALALNTSTNTLRMHTDCQPGREQPLAGNSPQARLHIPDDALVYFRQEPGFKKKFLGSMQVAKVLPYATRGPSDWSCDGVQPKRLSHPAGVATP